MRPVTNEEIDVLIQNMTPGQRRAFFLKIVQGYEGDNLSPKEVLAQVTGDDLKILLIDGVIKLVDINGRVIVPKGMTGVKDADVAFRHVQPVIDIADIYGRLRKHFGPEAKLPTLEEFGIRYAALQKEVLLNRQVNNLFKGTWFPICIPQTDPGDYGTLFETKYLSAAESSYLEAFPNRKFYNHRKGTFAEMVTVNEGTRHELLVERLKQGSVIGLYFTSPLQGFGIKADRRIIRHLPEGFCLSGGFDATAAFVAVPQTMAQGSNVPGTDCAALSWQWPVYSLYFGPSDGFLSFARTSLDVGRRCSAGLFFFR